MSGSRGGRGPAVGMALDMRGELRNASEQLQPSPKEVARLVSEYPAALRIRSGNRSRLAALCRADRVAANEGLLTGTWIAAVRVYGVRP